MVRPQHDEHCERQFVCDSALNGKSVGDDIELNCETDDEDIETERLDLSAGGRRREIFVMQDNGLQANTQST